VIESKNTFKGDILMSRIPPVEDMELPGHEGSGVTEMGMLFRVMGQRPQLAQDSMRLLETAMCSGTVDARLKELLAVRVSQVNHCFY
jgi:hypothetical protein